jgi:hypothetical protein
MVCGIIRSNRNASPRIILDLVHPRPADFPMVLATTSDFGCTLHEEQAPRPDSPPDGA